MTLIPAHLINSTGPEGLTPSGHRLQKVPLHQSVVDVFYDAPTGFVNPLVLFANHFGEIPNLLEIMEMDVRKGLKWFEKNFAPDTQTDNCIRRLRTKNEDEAFEEYYYRMPEGMLVYFCIGRDKISLLYQPTAMEAADRLSAYFRKFCRKTKRQKPVISLIVNGYDGLDTREMDISKTKLNIADNYNDDFGPVHRRILERLRKPKDKGIVLLHGKPGTGKTSYIRHLIASVKKEVIFLPPNMAGSATSPGLLTLFVDKPNSIFVIEDAEDIILDRESHIQSPVSALLNLADGLLSDCLNIQIICTFNTDLSRIDKALLRKGRLIANYEFRALEVEKAQRLSDKLGFTTTITEPATLSALYNQAEADFTPIERTKIGFRS